MMSLGLQGGARVGRLQDGVLYLFDALYYELN